MAGRPLESVTRLAVAVCYANPNPKHNRRNRTTRHTPYHHRDSVSPFQACIPILTLT